MSDSDWSDEIPDDMEVLFLGLLLKGPNWSPDETPEVEALQAAHLANIDRMRKSGELVAAGPFVDDGFIRGVYVFRGGSMEEAYAITGTDPSVSAGRLKFEIHPWWVKKGVFD